MGAIAVSKTEETQILRLQKTPGIPSKAGVVRAALRALERDTEGEKLRHEIQESVRRCAAADRMENRRLSGSGVATGRSEE